MVSCGKELFLGINLKEAAFAHGLIPICFLSVFYICQSVAQI